MKRAFRLRRILGEMPIHPLRLTYRVVPCRGAASMGLAAFETIRER